MKADKNILIGEDVHCSLPKLLTSRLLVQANSGGGKSWLIRRLLEQSHGHVQQLVIDPEGEFSTLREKFDYVLAARQGGDTVADPRSAKLLAERLLELGVSAILDIYELKAHERVRFVKSFLEALVDAPKRLWHPVIVVVDECHVYCPEKGHGEAESSGAVIDLCTRGRKRGFCAVLATQRISKLNKDAAAELNNKLIGRSSLDIDMKRAANELGFNSKDEMLRLRDLQDGQFFAFGPAICREVQIVKVGPVTTTHPESGSRLATVVPPPTEKVRAILSKLADLPAEAEAREKSVQDLKHEITNLKRELTEAKKMQPAPVNPLPPKEIRVVTDDDITLVRDVIARMKVIQDGVASLDQFRGDVHAIASRLHAIKTNKPEPIIKVVPTRPLTPTIRLSPQHREHTNGHSESHSLSLPIGERKILTACAQFGDVPKEDLTVLTGFKRSTRDAYIQRLREKGFVEDSNGFVTATSEGVDALGHYDPLLVGDELREYWLARLPEGERRILELLVEQYPAWVSREELEAPTGFKRSTRDAYLQRMKPKRIVEFGNGTVKASEKLFS